MSTPSKEVNLEQFARSCRSAGIKVTPQRTEIYRALMSSDDHPAAEQIYQRVKDRMPNLSLDTVYRTLRMLEEKGMIAPVRIRGERQRFDSNAHHHHHFICDTCGEVKDFYSEELDNFTPPSAMVGSARVATVYAEVHGTCESCSASAERE